jgi:enediyne biosynthesis protein E4
VLKKVYLLVLIFAYQGVIMGQSKFTDVTREAGITHQFQVLEGMFGGGACVFDFDNDGFEDVFITSGMKEDVLYKNNGDGTFKNVYVGSGLETSRGFVTQGAVSADVNRDGFRDLLITTITTKNEKKVIPRASNLLFLNNGDGTFKDVSEAYGFHDRKTFSTAASFGDFNGDGFPDLYIGNYFNEFKGELSSISDATIVGANQIAEGNLLMNTGGKSFKDVYKDYGLNHRGFGFGGIFTDFDNDQDLDLFVNHDFGYKRTPDLLLENKFPKKGFEDVAEKLHMDLKINSMGTAVGDYNNDGLMDYYMTNIRFNYFMVNKGGNKGFENMTQPLGLHYFAISWGANFADFDHDGDLDLFVANGDLNPNCQPMANFYFENKNGKFNDIASQNGLNGYELSRGSVVFDYDNDGDLDILVVNQIPVLDYPVQSTTKLYRNDSTKANWIKIKLKGTQADLNGIGSKIEIVAGGLKMIREVDGGASSHLSQNSVISHFGYGDASKIDTIRVLWIGGQIQEMYNVDANQLIEVVEPIIEKKEQPIMLYLVIGLILIVLLLVYYRRKSS